MKLTSKKIFVFISVLAIGLLLSSEGLAQEQTTKAKPKVFGNSDLVVVDKESGSNSENYKAPEEDNYRILNKEFIVDGRRLLTYATFSKYKEVLLLRKQLEPKRDEFIFFATEQPYSITYIIPPKAWKQYVDLVELWSKSPPETEETKNIYDSLGSRLSVKVSVSTIAGKGVQMFIGFADENNINHFSILLYGKELKDFIKFIKSPYSSTEK